MQTDRRVCRYGLATHTHTHTHTHTGARLLDLLAPSPKQQQAIAALPFPKPAVARSKRTQHFGRGAAAEAKLAARRLRQLDTWIAQLLVGQRLIVPELPHAADQTVRLTN